MRQLLTCIILAVLLLGSIASLTAQRYDNKEKTTLSVKRFSDQLWYGGNLVLGFNSSNIESIFQFGLTPMVGYKVTDGLSVGPRASFIYTSYKNRSAGVVDKVSWANYGIGPFIRQKLFIPNIFAHAEYEWLNRGVPVYQNTNNGIELTTERETQNNLYIGLGWNRGNGQAGSEIIVLYNLLVPDDSFESEFSYRFGFTFRF